MSLMSKMDQIEDRISRLGDIGSRPNKQEH